MKGKTTKLEPGVHFMEYFSLSRVAQSRSLLDR
jgi:hypothetical protein